MYRIMKSTNNGMDELELDSLDTVDLMMTFEDEFGIQMEMSEDIKTVGDIAKAIEEQTK